MRSFRRHIATPIYLLLCDLQLENMRKKVHALSHYSDLQLLNLSYPQMIDAGLTEAVRCFSIRRALKYALAGSATLRASALQVPSRAQSFSRSTTLLLPTDCTGTFHATASTERGIRCDGLMSNIFSIVKARQLQDRQ